MMHLVRTKPSSKAVLIDHLHREIAALRAIREELREELAAAEEPQPELDDQIRRTTAAMKERYREVWYLRKADREKR